MRSLLQHNALCLLLLIAALPALAQTADMVVDKKEIFIGEEVAITLSVSMSKANPPKVQFPQVGDTLIKLVEVLRKTGPDTLTTGPEVKETRIEQKIFITSFDSGYYAIPPFEFTINGAPARTEAFLLTVKMVEVDTTQGIKDIRDIYEVSLGWRDYLDAYWPYFAGSLALLALIAAVLIALRRIKISKRAAREFVAAAPTEKRPPHTIALERIALTRREKAYARNRVKQYHTELSDALRDYLEAVFNMPAHELTTRQIMERLRYADLPKGEMQSLQTMLRMADLVKFAKERPDDSQNDQAAVDAATFVERIHARLHAAAAVTGLEAQPSAGGQPQESPSNPEGPAPAEGDKKGEEQA